MGGWFEDRISALGKLDAYQFTYNLDAANVRVKLDANENWHIPRERLRQIVSSSAGEVDVRQYPLGCAQELCAAVAKRLRVPEKSIVPTEGIDQGIDLVCQSFLREADRAVIIGPTYSFYKLRSMLAGARCDEVSMNDDFSLPVERILKIAGKEGIVFVCSPNNPTGNQFRADDLERLFDSFPGLIVIDEAYVDFATQSIVAQVTRRRSLLVLRTFSKAFGLADLRLGFVIGNPEWMPTFLDRVQYPYPISGLSANIALQLLEEYDLVTDGIESLKREREWLVQKLERFQGIKVLPSVTNFVLLGLAIDYARVHAELLRRGIATKKVGRVLGLENCIRVTIGTREMNMSFLQALGEVLRNA
jgi:histidinol-phosphate aminotransferase